MMRSMTRRCEQGMTLIEMMVAIVISMVMSLAVFGVMSSFEGQRRTIRSGADLDQVGSVAMFQLDQWIRSAGSGFTQASAYAYGCQLYATKSGTQLLPMSGAMPAPFASVVPGAAGATGAFRLAPVLILPDQTTPGASGKTSDVLVLMSSGNNTGAVPSPFTSAPGSAVLNLGNNIAFSANDLVLMADQQQAATGGVAPCMVTQAGTVATTTPPTVNLAGAWYASSVGTVPVSSFTDQSMAFDLGASPTSASGGTPPSFQVIGVGDNNTLYSFDLLNLSGTQLQTRADNVFELHALYGIDNTGDGKIDDWVKADSGSYTPTALMDGSVAAATLIKNIRAIHVGLILRTALPERDNVTANPTLTLFSDVKATGPVAYSRDLTGTELKYRYRTVEATIPLRNNSF